MDLKSFLKSIKLNESTISMILGAIVIVVVGLLVINYFRDLDTGSTIPPIGTEDFEESTTLPSSYTVARGEDLWKIADNFYGTGYNWVDIASENDISDPNAIEEGQSLTIPDVAPRFVEDEEIALVIAPEEVESEGVEERVEPEVLVKTEKSPITGATYTVASGDTLWDIAVRAYGDGFRWVDIASANDLANPNLIHPGNVFTLPR